MPIAASTSSAPGTCRYQREKSATISFAVAASSGLAIFRVTFTKNSCSTWTLRQPSRDPHSCSTSARARSCLSPADSSCAYSKILVSTNLRSPLMDAVPAPVGLPAGTKVKSLVQPGQAPFAGGGISSFLLDQFPQHPGEQLRNRRAPPGCQYPGLPDIFFRK